MTELELRNKVVSVMRGWLGWSEANGKFKAIIDLYNTQRPLPRGYAVQYDDEWCATTVTAAGIQAGLHDIIFGECSCSKMIELYKAAGRWEENDAYVPQVGDIIMYYWKDGKDYATTDCTSPPNHVGYVMSVNGSAMTIIEGNKGEAVSTRSMKVNGRYIRGYCLPDYASKATEEDEDMDVERFTELWNEMREGLQDNDAGNYSKEARAWAQSTGLIEGNGRTASGEPNCMWQDILTREQFVAVLYRFAKMIGKA